MTESTRGVLAHVAKPTVARLGRWAAVFFCASIYDSQKNIPTFIPHKSTAERSDASTANHVSQQKRGETHHHTHSSEDEA